MSLFDEKNLIKWVVILPILSVIVTTIIFVSTGINSRKTNLEKEAFNKQVKFLKYHKEEVKNKVDHIISFLRDSKELQKEQSKQDVKHMVELALAIIKTIYDSNEHLGDDEILDKIKSSLRDIRFWNGTGYFFIYTLTGDCVLLPTKSSLEGTNFINLQDANKKFTIKDAIDIIKKYGEGYDEWYWYKPKEKIMKRKLGFIKAFLPLDIYIGTARYEEDILNNIKNKLVKSLEEREKEFFIYDKYGNSIMNNHKSIDVNEVSLAVIGGKIIPEGFFINHTVSTYFNIFKELNAGTFFVKYLPEFEWVVGAGIYTDEVKKSLILEKEKLKAGYVKMLKNRLFIAFIIMLVILATTVFFASNLKKVLKNYQKDLLEQKEKLLHSLKHDYLTSLPNRLLLTDRLEQSIKHFSRDNKKIAIIFIDIDKFKSINDSLGHDVGDILLKNIAKRLKKSIRSSDTVARFGGDEFVILLDGFRKVNDIIKVINKIEKSLIKPVIINEIRHSVTLSMGISVFPNDGENIQSILKNADIAMYKAKNEGGNRYRFFTQKMNEDTQNLIEMEKALKIGVEKGEFVLYYQPLINSKSGKIIGVEALLRWNHPKKGLIYPDQFISIAEQSSVIKDMGKWIIYEAMNQMKKWKNRGYNIEKMSINVAVKQLENSGFIDCIKNNLELTSCKAEWIELEIVERFAMKNVKKSIYVLNELRKLNIDISIDDFGTGYSSLSCLKELPITKLKIDRAFVKNILNSYEDKAIAESILALGLGLKLKVLAEGIENKEQREFFTYYGCHEMQGYLFSRPVPVNEVEKLLEKGWI